MSGPWDIAMEACQRHHASQRVDELAALLSLVQTQASLNGKAGPDVIVEIGCDAGGTLYAWRTMFPLARVYGVTLPVNSVLSGGQGYPREDFGAVVLEGDSHDRATLQRLKDQMGGRKADVLLIDGDHSRDGILADWNMYAPLVRAGGLTAFHDIANGSTPDAVKLWDEMSSQARACGEHPVELVSRAHRPVGFGVLKMAGERS